MKVRSGCYIFRPKDGTIVVVVKHKPIYWDVYRGTIGALICCHYVCSSLRLARCSASMNFSQFKLLGEEVKEDVGEILNRLECQMHEV